MPILSEQHRYLFLLAPRTASTAVAEALCSQGAGRWVPEKNLYDRRGRIILQKKHGTARDLLRFGLLTKNDLANLTVFTAVRNPFDSLVSLYVKKRTSYQPLRERDDTFVNRIPRFSSDMDFVMDHSFSEWIDYRYRVPARVPFLAIHMYRKYLRDADEIMRFETVEADLGRIADRLGVGVVNLTQKNVTQERRPAYRDYYTDRSRRIVQKIFRPDLERFHYKF